MTPEAQRIAIAEACGWKRSTRTHPDVPQIWIAPKTGESWSYLPYYLSDLNAMHEAEDVLFAMANTNEEAYSHQLTCVTRGWRTYRATAAQRAEAFLRTLNLWDDSK